MRIEVGLDDFLACLANTSADSDNWTVWSSYCDRYRVVFDTIFKQFSIPKDAELVNYVNHCSLDAFADKAKQSVEMLSQSDVEHLCRTSAAYYGFDEDFDVYFLVGLGNIGGTCSPDPRFLYIGLEFVVSESFRFLISHELNHLVRFVRLGVNRLSDLPNFTVQDLVIAEGLATLAPLVISETPIHDETLRQALMISPDHYERLVQQANELERKIVADADKQLDKSMMQKYFSVVNPYGTPIAGYFIGARWISSLLEAGASFKDLTSCPTTNIVQRLSLIHI